MQNYTHVYIVCIYSTHLHRISTTAVISAKTHQSIHLKIY